MRAKFFWWLAGAFILGIVPIVLPMTGWELAKDRAQQIVYISVALGVLWGIFGVISWWREKKEPSVMTSGPKFIDQSINAHNNSGTINQTNNNTFGSIRVAFDTHLQSELLRHAPRDKPVVLMTIGSDADQLIGNQVEEFLVTNGFSVSRSRIGMKVPPPSQPYSLNLGNEQTTITVSPSTPPA